MMKHNTKYILLASVLALLTVTACQHEELTVNNPAGDGILNFSIGFAGSGELTLTKGATLTSADGSVSIPLSCTVTDGIEVNLPGSDEPVSATRGAQYNSETEMLAGNIKTFTAAGWNADKSVFVPTTDVSYTDGLWQTSNVYRWRGSDDKVFLAYANLPSGATVTNSVDSAVKQTFAYTVPTDARAQNDVMLGWYEGNGGGTLTAAITMVHPLTAVVFKKGEMEDVTAIKRISIAGVYSEGTAEVTYDLSGSTVVPSYVWSDTRTGSKTVTLAPLSPAESLEIDDDDNVIGVPFIILPQEVAANTLTLTITVVKNGADAVLTAFIPAGTWAEGKTNTFTLGYEPIYHVTYNMNGGSGDAPVDPASYESGSSATVLSPDGTPTKDGVYSFIRWNTASDGSGMVYYPNDNINITGNVTLYAQYSSTLARGSDFNTAIGNATNVIFGNYNIYSSLVGEWEGGADTSDGSNGSIRIFKLNDNEDVYVLSKGVIYLGTSCRDMFLGKTNLTSINFGGNVIDTRRVEQFGLMFAGCSNLTTLDLSDFDTRGATGGVNDNGRFFESCSKLETIYVGEYWDLYTRPNESDNAQCFSGCTSLVGGNGTVYSDSHKGIDYARIDGQGGNPGYLTFLTATAM